jgi:hypothetical protein
VYSTKWGYDIYTNEQVDQNDLGMDSTGIAMNSTGITISDALKSRLAKSHIGGKEVNRM